MGDHGRRVQAQEWVSKDGERRSNALAGRGSHPKHRFSRFWTRSSFQVAVSRGSRTMIKVVYIGGTRERRTEHSLLRCICANV